MKYRYDRLPRYESVDEFIDDYKKGRKNVEVPLKSIRRVWLEVKLDYPTIFFKDFAVLVGVKRHYVSKWIGNGRIQRRHVSAILEALNCSEAELRKYFVIVKDSSYKRISKR